MTAIGFKPLTRDWEGPLYVLFGLHSRHSRTARYQADVEGRKFDLYAPLFMLGRLAQGDVPEKLIALIGKGPETVRILGLSPTNYSLRADSEVCEYAFAEKKVNSIQYKVAHEHQTYSIYLPVEIFGTEPSPQKIYLRLGVPA